MTKNLFNFYSLESPTEEEGNLNKRLVISPSKKKIFVGVKKLCCICKNYLAVMLTIVEASQDALKKEQGANCLIE